MAVNSTEAVFYTGKNYTGDSYTYNEREVVYSLPADLNDKFLSVEIGSLVKVFAWRHYTDTQAGQIYQIWSESQPDLSSIDGLSKFVVSPEESELLAIKVINNTEDGKVYSAFIRTFTINNPVYIYTGEDYQVVGLIPDDGREYVTDVIVFDAATNIPVIHGAAYFYYDANADTLQVTTYDETWPSGLELRKSTDYRFDLLINEVSDVTTGVAR